MQSPRTTQIMAILNITPDSFSDGGHLTEVSAILREAEHALAAGADILDIGGESTRPGSVTVSAEEELSRVLPAIQAIRQQFPQAVLSIDTRKAQVAKAALEAGARIINDVSGLQYDPDIAQIAAAYDAQLVITHSQGTPDVMQQNPQYPAGVIQEIQAFFERQIAQALAAGVKRHQLILDPGFGFGKTVEHNLDLLNQLDAFQTLDLPLLAGVSRKSFLTLGNRDIHVREREALTASALMIAIQKGARIIRVHDVETQLPVIRLAERLSQTQQSATEGKTKAGAAL